MQSFMGQTEQVYGGGDDYSIGDPVHTTHTYVLKTDYAFISIKSRAQKSYDIPLMYLEEETVGAVVFPECHLPEVRSIIVVLQELVSNTVKHASETRLVLSSEEVRRSHTSNGEFRWHFAIAPATASCSLIAPEQANNAPRRPSIRNQDCYPNFQLQLTVHRRGLFMRKIDLKRSIRYVPRPPQDGLSTLLPPPHTHTLAIAPRNLPSAWTENKCPSIIVRGAIFDQHEVEVECRPVIPTSYPVNDTIPLRLSMRCRDREALDLFAVPHVIDVRLLKVLAFGKNAALASPPFTLRDRNSYHITKWVATALWNVDGHATWENDLWRILLNGRLIRDAGAEISHSFAEPGMALMYYVCIFPFRSNDFRPLCAPDRILFYGKIPLAD